MNRTMHGGELEPKTVLNNSVAMQLVAKAYTVAEKSQRRNQSGGFFSGGNPRKV
jgi:hypothetical protein